MGEIIALIIVISLAIALAPFILPLIGVGLALFAALFFLAALDNKQKNETINTNPDTRKS